MPRKPEGSESHLAPLGPVERYVRQAPLRRPAAVSPPGEDHPEDLSCLVELQPCGSGRRGIRSGDALAVRVELEYVKRADQAAVANLAASRGLHMRTQVRTRRIRHADAVVLVAPDDDFLARPGLLDQFLAQNRLATPDEVPALGERGAVPLWGLLIVRSSSESCSPAANVNSSNNIAPSTSCLNRAAATPARSMSGGRSDRSFQRFGGSKIIRRDAAPMHCHVAYGSSPAVWHLRHSRCR